MVVALLGRQKLGSNSALEFEIDPLLICLSNTFLFG